MSNRVEKFVDISLIRIDRIPLGVVALKYANDLKAGAIFPAIKVALRPDGFFEIRDGRHRWLAHKLCERKTILAKYSDRPLEKNHLYNLNTMYGGNG